MPRNSRALLPAEIRTRLEPMRARADTLMGFCTLRKQHLLLRVPVARYPPRNTGWGAKPESSAPRRTGPRQQKYVRIP
jgi:hypothetical protein